MRDIRLKLGIKIPGSDFFDRYAKDLKLALDKNDQMKEYKTFTDGLGRIQSRHKQYYKGLEVIGAEYILQEKDNAVDYAIGKIITGLDLDTTAHLSEEEALTSAKCSSAAGGCPWLARPDQYSISKKGLAITSKGFKMTKESARLVWRFVISAKDRPESNTWEIDAKTAEVVNQTSNIIYDNPATPPPLDTAQNAACSGWSRYNDVVDFVGVKEEDDVYYLRCRAGGSDPKCPVEIDTVDARIPNSQGLDPNQTGYFSSNSHSSYFQDTEDAVGISVHWGLQKAVDYYFKTFHWLGLDGLGKETITASVKRITPPNAYYDPTDHSFSFDGYGNGSLEGPQVDLDTVGHEFNHGVLHHMVDLQYAGETGALDEGLADIFGVLVKQFATGNLDWKSGDDSHFNAGFLRNLSDPKSDTPPDPDTYYTWPTTFTCDENNDYCWVHAFSTIFGHWFYLLVSGGAGTNDIHHDYNVAGIGVDDAAQIVFRTMTTKFLPTSNFMDARIGSIAAADELFQGKPEHDTIVESVTNAWYAIGVGDLSGVEVSPPDGSQNVPPWPTILGWEDQPSEFQWEVQVSTVSDFSQDVLTQGTATATVSPMHAGSPFSSVNFNLKPLTDYYWRVHAKKNSTPQNAPPRGLNVSAQDLVDKRVSSPSDGVNPAAPPDWGRWSPTRYFKTDSRMPILKSPMGVASGDKIEKIGSLVTYGNDATTTGSAAMMDANPWAPEFKWTGVDGGKKYWVQTSENADLGIVSSSGLTSTKPLVNQDTFSTPPLQSISISGLSVDPNNPANHDGGSQALKGVLPGALKVDHTYYWGVLPYGPEDILGNWSNHQQGQIFRTSFPQTALQSPANGAKVVPWGVTLKWNSVSGAIGYLVKVSKNPDLSSPLALGPDPTGTSQAVSIPSDASTPQTVYYWSVTPKGPFPYFELGQASSVRSFTADYQLTQPVLVSPPDKGFVVYGCGTDCSFTWKAVANAAKYKLTFFKRNSDGTAGGIVRDTTMTAAAPDTQGNVGYPMNVAGSNDPNVYGYCWQVQALGPNDAPGIVSKVFCYGLSPDKVVLKTPLDGYSAVDYHDVVFRWESRFAPMGYDLIISGITPGQFTTIHIATSLINQVPLNSYTMTLQPNTDYTWTVHAPGLPGSPSGSSGVFFKFTTKTCAPLATPHITNPSGKFDVHGCHAGASYPFNLHWDDVTGAVSYEVRAYLLPNADAGDYTTKQSEGVQSVMSPSATISVLPNDAYEFEVRAQSSCGSWSAPSPYYTKLVCD